MASSISATTPVTTPADTDEPLMAMPSGPIVPAGAVCATVLPATSAAHTLLPGATRSGFITRSIAVGPLELYVVTTSSDRLAVP